MTTVLTPETLALIGVTGARRWAAAPVGANDIRRFTQAAMEIDPIHFDDNAAIAAGFPGIVAPPLYPLHAFPRPAGTPDPFEEGCLDPDWDGIDIVEDDLPPVNLPLERLLNGGVEATVYQLTRPGDLLSSQSRYADIAERVGRDGGPMVFVVVETTYRNQTDDLLLVTRTTMIAR